jgi:hypothetical protein
MDDQALKRLMIDDALGELSPDVSWLLMEYLQVVPAGESERLAWSKLAADARRALPGQPTEQLPPFPAGARFSFPWRSLGTGVSIAASLAIGVGVGLRMPRSASPPREVAVVVPLTATEVPASNNSLSSGGGGFWSSKRLLAYAQQQKRPESSPLRWTSPVRIPQLGDNR